MEKTVKSRLGRGLGSLLNISSAAESNDSVDVANRLSAMNLDGTHAAPALASGEIVRRIALDRVHPNPHQPRRLFDADRLRELAASLKSSGLIQPIVVRPFEDGFQLIAGERRLRAAKLAELPDIPAIVREANGYEQAQLALIENIHREDLNPVERAQSYQALIEQLGLTQQELASRLGEDRSAVANFLRLLTLPQQVIDLVAAGQLSFGHAKLLAGLKNAEEQTQLANISVEQGLSVRRLEQLVAENGQKTETGSIKTAASGAEAHRAEVERSLSRQLGTRVELRSGARGKGKLIFYYDTLDAFDALLKRMSCSIDE